MQKIFFDTRILDEKCRSKFSLSEDLMMENAASALEEKLAGKKSILILCGSGNNGGDGYALARRLQAKNISLFVIACLAEKSDMCKLQKKRAEQCGVNFIPIDEADRLLENTKFDAIVDCIFGSGFHGVLPEKILALVKKINQIDSYKLACDIPSGLDAFGNADGECFIANQTVTMGALKLALFSDKAKDVCHEISCAGLGLSREVFESQGEQNTAAERFFLLDEGDCKFPIRKKQNSNKGTFGHTVNIAGDKIGAAVIASCAALKFGSGLVTLVDLKTKRQSGEKISLDENGLPAESIIPYEIMCASESDFPENTTAFAIGMGLGRNGDGKKIKNCCSRNLPAVLDADIFYYDEIFEILQNRSENNIPTVLTPHPKEFSVLLKNCGSGNFSTSDAVKNRINLIKDFCEKFPNIVLLLKGASVVIAQKSEADLNLFFNPHGTPALAKAGSGDILTGLIASLLAQNYSALEAAKSASLAHALASKDFYPNFSLTPFSLLRKL